MNPFWRRKIKSLKNLHDVSNQICIVNRVRKKFKFQESLERLFRTPNIMTYWPIQLTVKSAETSFKNSLGIFLSLIRMLNGNPFLKKKTKQI